MSSQTIQKFAISCNSLGTWSTLQCFSYSVIKAWLFIFQLVHVIISSAAKAVINIAYSHNFLLLYSSMLLVITQSRFQLPNCLPREEAAQMRRWLAFKNLYMYKWCSCFYPCDYDHKALKNWLLFEIFQCLWSLSHRRAICWPLEWYCRCTS